MVDNNSASQTEMTPVTTVACKVCFENIKDGASKCIHCGSYQDRFRHILRWTTLFVSILGIAPLWGIANSLHKLAFSSNNANIEAAITSCGNSEIVVAFANSGKTDGIVTNTQLELVYKDKVITAKYDIRALNRPSNFVVSPNSTPILVTYKAYISDTETLFVPSGTNQPSRSMKVIVDWVDFKDTRKQLVRKCSCP